ncbi:hypothetical protein EHE19_018515 [Ruminiclostridium herbifermentans]|uniref:Oligosaccharide repeat unit polymerase n=1 Tax=Ruminiclostridium herbifermentans TaxID=2488810 RepID=A0A4U7JCH9_9FIRM|nr:hypothetical protein [Ruminiclostridium herbifermentans]QNU66800.1 hypothetical protein EHE19_018515 [Ruminiclostridium herbifermentans]
MECNGNNIRPPKKINIILILGVLAFRISLDYAYKNMICVLYQNYKFEYTPNNTNLILSYLVLIIITSLFATVFNSRNPSSIMILLLYIMSYIPNTSLYYGMGLPHYFLLYSSLFWFIMIALYPFICKIKIKRIKSTNNKITIKCVKFVPFAFLILIVVFSAYYNGLYITLDLSIVYDLRAAAKENSFGPILSRLIPWAGNIVFPVSAAIALKNKKFIVLGVFTFAQIITFSLAGTKTYLFAFAFSIIGVILINSHKYFKYLPFGLAGITVLGYSMYKLFNSVFIANYIVRRVLFTTSYNCWGYIEFFISNEKLYLRNSFMRWLKNYGVKIPYADNFSSFMGDLLYDRPDANVPAGTVADAFGNFGILGLILYPLFMVIMFRLLDKVSTNIPSACVLPVIITSAEYILNGNVFSVMLTYGYWFALIYFYYMTKTGIVSADRKIKKLGKSFDAST